MEHWNLSGDLAKRKLQGLYRTRQVIDGPQGANVIIDGQSLVNFSSNDYLGLANHADVITAFKKSVDTEGVGSGAAHLICGHGREHHALEEELAAFTGRERALVFSTGYMANLGVISALVGKGDAVFEDKLNHASLIDGGLISGANFRRYAHNNLNRLQQLQAKSSCEKQLIVSDGIFSMDGDEADVRGLAVIAKQSGALLMIDDAHGIGVLGDKGAGLLEKLALDQQQVPILMGTFGKALGTAGAFVAGSDALIETLIQRARTYIYTTAMPSAIMAATRASINVCQTESWRREKLASLITQFQRGAQQLGLNMMRSNTPIQPIVLGGSHVAVETSEQLRAKGFLVTAIREPTVPKGSARLRVTLSASHSEGQIDALLMAIDESIKA